MIASENIYEKIEIVEREVVDGRNGEEFTGNYLVRFTTYAQEKYQSGREKEIYDQLTALRRVKFKIRYNKAINELMLVRFNGDLYDIRGIDHHKRTDTYLFVERGKE